MQYTETENNLIISDFRPEDCIDFLSMESISDVGVQYPQPQNVKYPIDPPPNSRDAKEKIILSPISPNFETLKEQNQLFITPLQPQKQISKKPSIQIKNSSSRPSVNTSGSFMKYFHTRRFLNRILQNKYQSHKLQPKHLEIINDLSSNYDTQIFGKQQNTLRPLGLMKSLHLPMSPTFTKKIGRHIKNAFEIVQHKFDQILQQIPVIQPENKGRITWDILLSFTRLYFIVLIPIDMVFAERLLYSDKLIIVTTFQTLLLVTDMFINFNTAYFQNGQIVSERKKIIQHNLSKGFGFDALSILFLICLLFVNWDDIGDNEPYVFIALLSFIVQYQNITKLTRIFEEVLNLNKIQAGFLELAKLITLLIYILHLSACIWVGCGRISYAVTDGTSWMIKENIYNEQWIVQYLRSFYFCTVTMFTVGYGDLTPQSNLEHIVCIFFIMVFSIQLPYSVNTVGAIIDEISKYSEQKLQKLRVINTYMAKKKINYDLQVKIRQYLTYYWDCENSQIQQEVKGILEQLSENLRLSLMLEANSLILNSCDLFSKFLSPQFTKALVNKIRYLDVQPENIVDFSEQPDAYQNHYLAFIENGTIEVVGGLNTQKNDNYIKQLTTGQVFGLYDFITGCSSNECFKSKGFTKLLILPRSQFLKILKEFPEDKEKYCQIKDDLLQNNGQIFLRQIGVSCYMCNSRDHILKNCPIIQFKADRERIIKSYIYDFKQNRKKQFRCKKKNEFNSLVDQRIVKEIAEYFKEDFWQELKYYETNENNDNDQQSPQFSNTSDEGKDYIRLTPMHQSSKQISNHRFKVQKQFRVLQLNDLHQPRRMRQNTISPKYSTNQINVEQQQHQHVQQMIPRTHSSIVDNVSQESQITPEKQEDDESQRKNTAQTQKEEQLSLPKSAFRQLQLNQFPLSLRKKNSKLEIDKDVQKKNSVQVSINYQELRDNLNLIQSRLNALKHFSEHENSILVLENIQQMINHQLEEKFNCIDNFDLQNDFQYYCPHNNFMNLEVSNCYNKLLIENLSRFIKYLFYPFVYIKKYSKLDQEDNYKLERQRKTLSFSKKKPTILIKFRDKARLMLSTRRIVPE